MGSPARAGRLVVATATPVASHMPAAEVPRGARDLAGEVTPISLPARAALPTAQLSRSAVALPAPATATVLEELAAPEYRRDGSITGRSLTFAQRARAAWPGTCCPVKSGPAWPRSVGRPQLPPLLDSSHGAGAAGVPVAGVDGKGWHPSGRAAGSAAKVRARYADL